MDSPPIDVRPEDWAIVADILRRHVPDRDVWAFGSRVTRTARQFSDLDLAIMGDAPMSLVMRATLADAFSESDLPFKVDVIDWATTSEPFRKIVERDRVIAQRSANPIAGADA